MSYVSEVNAQTTNKLIFKVEKTVGVDLWVIKSQEI